MEKIVLWKDREKQLLDPELFSKKAEELAITTKEDIETAKNSNKRTQIRKFYDEAVRLNHTAKTRQNDWNNIIPMVHMLTAKAAYAQGRKLISKNFMGFIKESVNQIERPEDLNVFCNFFEAFMGFYRLHGPNN
jgi:CRISPR-associated protein Csm2